jgi:chemotaxis protein MotB
VTRRRKYKRQSNHERWLVSYADFITLLFAFFVVMYSTSQVDKRKVGKLAVAIQVAFQQLGVFPDSNTQIPVNPNDPMPFSTVQEIDNVARTASLGRLVASPGEIPSSTEEDGDLKSLRRQLQQTLVAQIARHEVTLRSTPDGLVISLKEIGFFDSGSASVKADSRSAFGRIATELARRPYHLRIEGHTDDVPIHNAQFASNWELSTTRSTELVRLLIVQYGFSPDRLSAAGYAQYHPIADNAAPGGRAQNRRVDIVILRKGNEKSAVSQEGQSPSPGAK